MVSPSCGTPWSVDAPWLAPGVVACAEPEPLPTDDPTDRRR
jgi:hypothetical protein